MRDDEKNEPDEISIDLAGVIDPDDPHMRVLPDGTIVVNDDDE